MTGCYYYVSFCIAATKYIQVWIFDYYLIILKHSQAGLCSRNTLDLIRDTRFEFQLGHQPSWQDLRATSRSFQANAGIISRSAHNRFLRNPFQFIFRQPSHLSTLRSLDTNRAVKFPPPQAEIETENSVQSFLTCSHFEAAFSGIRTEIVAHLSIKTNAVRINNLEKKRPFWKPLKSPAHFWN
jgi:hypothetical protein